MASPSPSPSPSPDRGAPDAPPSSPDRRPDERPRAATPPGADAAGTGDGAPGSAEDEAATRDDAPADGRPPLGSDPTPLPKINPLKVGFVLATIQFGATLWFLGRCSS